MIISTRIKQKAFHSLNLLNRSNVNSLHVGVKTDACFQNNLEIQLEIQIPTLYEMRMS